MLCGRYEEALIAAAAQQQGADQLPPKVREHVAGCEACRSALKMQQVLLASIAAGLEKRVRGEVPASLVAGVRTRLVTERAAYDGIRLQWAGVAALLVVALGAAMFREALHRAKPTDNAAVQVVSVPDGVSHNLQPRAAEHINQKGKQEGKRSGQIGETKLVEPDMKPLVPSEQARLMDIVVRRIRAGELDGRMLQLDSKSEMEELAIAPLRVEALETVSEEAELDPQRIANGQSRESERSTK